jgi:hypothetical protein
MKHLKQTRQLFYLQVYFNIFHGGRFNAKMKRLFIFYGVLFCTGISLVQSAVSAQQPVVQYSADSARTLTEVQVMGNRYREVIPSQILQGERLEALNVLSVADALRYFSDIQLKDYGGVGGLKTVGVRSMGNIEFQL